MLVDSKTTRPELKLDGWAKDFVAFHARFADLFARSEPRQQMDKYLRGLLASLPRRNGWQMAEAMGDRRSDSMQSLLAHARWDCDTARDRTKQFLRQELGDPEGIAVLDKTGFIKDGDQSVGVQRQYSGTAGKVENCQIAVLLGDQGQKGHALLDRRLYLPKSWCDGPVRRKRARVPSTVGFRTKPQLGEQMLRHALAQGVPIRWVSGDEVYGDDPKLRHAVEAWGLGSVLGVAKTTPVYAQGGLRRSAPNAAGPPQRKGPSPRATPKPTDWQTVEQLIANQLAERWRTLVCQAGEKGPIRYAWTRRRVCDRRQGTPGRRLWLLARRQLHPPWEIAYFFCAAPKGTSLGKLARVACSRGVIEQCIREAKGDTGMDQYEVRSWPAWHRHILLCLMAYAWLASVRHRSLKKNGTGPGRAECTRGTPAA